MVKCIVFRKFYLFVSLAFLISCITKTKEINLDNSLAWKLKEGTVGYKIEVDSINKFNGNASLKVIGNPLQSTAFASFSRHIPFDSKELKLVKISAYIKIENLEKPPVLWCQVWNSNKKQMIGFVNSELQGLKIKKSNLWKLYSMTVLVNQNAKSLVVGGYFKGKGKLWFSNFKIEELRKTVAEKNNSLNSYVDEVNKLIKENSLFRDSLNWVAIEKDLAYLKSSIDTGDVDLINQYYTNTLRNAGDIHSFFQNKIASVAYSTKNTNSDKPVAKLIDRYYGYISVPGFGSVDSVTINKFADTIQNLIKILDKNNIKGWIVDLRTNTGGNMYPMIAGLGPLIGEGDLGYFIGKEKYAWSYKNGRCGSAIVSRPYILKNKNVKTAVLIGEMTGSSGEMTAISFIGKPDVRTFGQPTAGYTTANGMYPLSNGGNLLLASSYTADRNKKKYLSKIHPDQHIEKKLSDDMVFKEMIKWLDKP